MIVELSFWGTSMTFVFFQWAYITMIIVLVQDFAIFDINLAGCTGSRRHFLSANYFFFKKNTNFYFLASQSGAWREKRFTACAPVYAAQVHITAV